MCAVGRPLHLEKVLARDEEVASKRLEQLREHVDEMDAATLVRELEIPREYYNAGITILQSFIRLLHEEFKDNVQSASIRQEKDKLAGHAARTSFSNSATKASGSLAQM